MDELNLRDKFLAAAREAKPYYERHEVSGFGTIHIKKLGVGERDRFDPLINDKLGNRVAVLLHCCFDDRGMHIFEESEVDLIRQLDPDIVDPIVRKAMILNGLRDEDQKAIAKNSNGQPGNSSSS